MFNRTHLLIVVLALAGAAAGLFAGRALRPAARESVDETASLAIGSARAEATLPDVEGHMQSLSQWDGKLVLLNFWASWCAPCVDEMPLLDRAQHRHAAGGMQIVGIASDAAGPTKAFLARHPVAYPILIDDPARGHDLSSAYGNTRNVLPYSVLIGRDGRVVAQHAGNFSESSLAKWLAPFLNP